jgi:hypothetical protein
MVDVLMEVAGERTDGEGDEKALRIKAEDIV